MATSNSVMWTCTPSAGRREILAATAAGSNCKLRMCICNLTPLIGTTFLQVFYQGVDRVGLLPPSFGLSFVMKEHGFWICFVCPAECLLDLVGTSVPDGWAQTFHAHQGLHSPRPKRRRVRERARRCVGCSRATDRQIAGKCSGLSPAIRDYVNRIHRCADQNAAAIGEFAH